MIKETKTSLFTVKATMQSLAMMCLMALPLYMEWDSGLFLFVAKAIAIFLSVMSIVGGLIMVLTVGTSKDEKLIVLLKEKLKKVDKEKLKRKSQINLLSILTYLLVYLLGFEMLAWVAFGAFVVMIFYQQKIIKMLKKIELHGK